MQEEWLPSDKPQGQVRLEDRVRPWVEGMKTLVISNRMDPELEKRLAEKLGLDITWAICDVRRAQAQAKAISKNKYDLVIGQTGFLSHKIETIIAKACVANQTPYIRADKMRPTSTAMALIRDLGIDITKAPPVVERIIISAPPVESKNRRTRRRTIVTVPQQPEDYKGLDIDILKFLEGQKTYFRLDTLFRALPGIPLILTPEGEINWNRMRPWMSAVGKILRDLNYINAQVPQAVDPKRPRVWVRHDRQHTIGISFEGVRERPSDRSPGEVARSQPPPRPREKTSARKKKQSFAGLRWLRRYGTEIRRHAKGRMYVHPEDILRLLVPDLPPVDEIVWQDYMFWTKNSAPILRKLGFKPSQREFDGRKARVWVHKKAPRYMRMSSPGEEYLAPVDKAPRPRRAPVTPKPTQRSRPAAQAPTQPHVHPGGAGVEFLSGSAQLPTPAPSAGPKAVRISFSSMSGGSADELLLVLTQAGWAVSFGP